MISMVGAIRIERISLGLQPSAITRLAQPPWSPRWNLHPRPPVYETGALLTELLGHFLILPRWSRRRDLHPASRLYRSRILLVGRPLHTQCCSQYSFLSQWMRWASQLCKSACRHIPSSLLCPSSNTSSCPIWHLMH